MSVNIEEYINNPIKRHIIGELMKHKKLKYSQLMPEDTDNVLFNYHLQHLVKAKLLVKEENYYSFSVEGWNATSHISYDGLCFHKFVGRLRIYIIKDEKVLLHARTISPWKGDTTALWRKLEYGKSLLASAREQIRESIGIAIKPEFIGTVRTIIQNRDQDTLDDSLYYVCVSRGYEGALKSHDEQGNALIWESLSDAVKIEKENKGVGEKTIAIMERLQSSNFDPFAFEEIIIRESL